MTDSSAREHSTRTFAILALGTTCFTLLQSLVVPALPTFQHQMHASEESVAWILTAYLLSASVATPIIGRLGDMYGKQRVLIFTIGALAIGTLVAGLADSIPVLLVGRFIQGSGQGLFPLGFGIIRDEFPARRVPGAIGVMSSLLGIGGGAGVILAGPIIEHLSIHWLFWLPLLGIVPAMFATMRWVPESPVKVPGRVNWLAAALMSAGLVAILVAVSETTVWGWTSPKTIGLIAAGCVALAGWVLVELRARQPLIDMRMMAIRGVWTTNLSGFLFGVGMYSSFVLIPQYVQEPPRTGYGFGAAITTSGLYLLPSTVAMVAIAPMIGRLERRYGSRTLMIIGGAFVAAAYLLLTTRRDESWQVLSASLLLGVGIGLAFATMANLIVENVRADQTGAASGVNAVMRTLGGALGGQVAATFLANDVFRGLPTAHAYTLAFGVCALATAIGFATSFLIPRRGRMDVSVAPPITIDELAREPAAATAE